MDFEEMVYYLRKTIKVPLKNFEKTKKFVKLGTLFYTVIFISVNLIYLYPFSFPASAQNNNVKIETANFDEETSKIRLLKGFISANETRNLEKTLQTQTFLICRRFWLDEPATAKAEDGTCKFNYQEVRNNLKFNKLKQKFNKIPDFSNFP